MSEKSPGEWSYEQFADRYAAIIGHKPHNAYYEIPATRALIPPVRGWRVLDAGCGPGHNAAWLLEQGAAHVTAIDVTPDFIRIAGERLTPYGERAQVIRADLAQPLTFAAENSFDLVLCQLVLHYIEDWDVPLREFRRVLKPGGVLVLSVGHPMDDWAYAQRILGEHSYFETVQFDAEWGGFGEPRPVVRSYRRTLEGTIQPLLDAGFRLEKLVEPLPTEEFRQADPDDYAQLMHKPAFLCIRAHPGSSPA